MAPPPPASPSSPQSLFNLNPNPQPRTGSPIYHPTPFTIQTYFANTPSSTSTSTPNQHDHPAPLPELLYTIHPQSIWTSMKRYKEFVLNGTPYHINDQIQYQLATSVYQPRPSLAGQVPPTTCSSPAVAHILEIRGHSATHVYVRVYLFHPAGPGPVTPEGERREYVASNEMAVLDARSVQGKVRVVRREAGGQPMPCGGGVVGRRNEQQQQQEEEEEEGAPPVVGWWWRYLDVHSAV